MKSLALLSALVLAAGTVGAQESYGTIRSTTKLRGDGSSSTTTVDPDARTATEVITDAKGKVQRKTTYLLGEKDMASGAIFSDAKGQVIYKASYKRDGYGRVVECAFAGPDDRYLGKRLFTFGVGDQVAKMEDYDANGQLIARPQAAAPGKAARKGR